MKKNRKKKSLLVTALALLLVVGATFAWMFSTDSKTNNFKAGEFGNNKAVLREIFENEKNWKPGGIITKRVSVENNGRDSVVARIRFTENLSLLSLNASGAVEEIRTTSPTPATTLPAGVAAEEPKIVGIDHLTAANGWSEVGATGNVQFDTTKKPADANIKVFEKEVTDSKGVTYPTHFVYYDRGASHGADRYQAMAATITKIGTGTSGTVEFETPLYIYYHRLDSTPQSWIVSLPTAASVISGTTGTLLSDSGAANQKITIQYANLTATATQDNWLYNEHDGYFYYIGAIKGYGESNPLMNSVTLADDAGERYSLADLDLTIDMQAIQNTRPAITATSGGGWGLDPSDPDDLAIITALEDVDAITPQ